MEGKKLDPAKLDQETLDILREAETAINNRLGSEATDSEVYLIALNRTRKK